MEVHLGVLYNSNICEGPNVVQTPCIGASALPHQKSLFTMLSKMGTFSFKFVSTPIPVRFNAKMER